MANIKDYLSAGDPVDADKIIGTQDSDQTVAKNFLFSNIWNWIKSKISAGIDEFDFTGVNNGYKNRRINWDDVNQCPAYYNDRTQVRHQIGREFWVRAYNDTGATIPNGSIVQITGSQGANPTMGLAIATALSTSDVIGWVTEDVLDSSEGEVTVIGKLSDVNTNGFASGTQLYLSDTVAGSFTDTPPDIPNFIVPVGSVIKTGTTDGIIYARLGQIIPPNEGQKSWSYRSYKFITGDDNWVAGSYESMPAFTPSIGGGDTIGQLNEMHTAHAMIVLGASSTNMVVRVTGTRFDTTTGTLTPNYTSDIDTSGGSINQFYETPEHFVGIVEYTLLSGTAVICNGGLVKYWDNNNKRFGLTMLEWNGYCGTNDIVDLELYIKNDSAFAYNVLGADFNPELIISDELGINTTIYEDRNFNYKVVGLTDIVDGDGSEGIMFKVISNNENSVLYSNVSIQLLERRIFI
jgi:hypothetical protein